MEGNRFRGRTGQAAAVFLYGVALLTAPLALLPQWEPVNGPGLVAVVVLTLPVVLVLALRPGSVPTALGAVVAGGLVTAAAVLTGGVASPWHPLIALPLLAAAVVLPVRSLMLVAASYVAARLGLLLASGDVRDVTPVAVHVAVDLAMTGLVAAWAAARAEVREVDRLCAAIDEAGSADEVSDAIRVLLRDDLVAACLVVVDGTPVTLAEAIADVGRGAGPVGQTFRVAPHDAFAFVASTGPVQTHPDATSRDQGERLAAERRYGSLATFPLRTRAALVGYVVLCSDRPDAFPRRRLERLERWIDPLAAPVASFLVRRERDARLAAALAGRVLTADLAQVRSVDQLASLAVRRTAELLGADDVAMLVSDAEEPHLLRSVAAVGVLGRDEVVDTRSEPSAVHAAMARRAAVWVPDVRVSSVVDAARSGRTGTESLLAVPLLAGDGALGGLHVAWRAPRMMRPDEFDLATAVGAEISAALLRLEVEDRLRAQATRDPLTGLLNHAAFHEEVARALAGIGRGRGPVALVLADLDHLKYLNDLHGHAVGDAALRAVAGVLASEARATDAVGRLGGDEFGWLLVGTSPDDAIIAAERAVRLVAGRASDPVGFLSVSAGVSVTASVIEPEALFERADAALYAAKARGRGVALLSGGGAGRAGVGEEPAPPGHAPTATDPDAAATLEGAAAAVAHEWTALFRASGCAVSLLDDAGTTLVEVASSLVGGAAGNGYAAARFPSVARALGEHRVTVSRDDDPEADPGEAEMLRELGQRSMLVVPLVRRGRAHGVVEVFDARPRAFTADERRLALGLAGYVAAVLERFPGSGRPADRSAGDAPAGD